MKRLHIDIETYCNLDVSKVGVYRYTEDESFRIILFAYSFDYEPVTVIDCSKDEFPGESLPAQVWKALTDPSVLKIAHNANFEYVCIETYYGIRLDLSQWECTMIASSYLGLPLGLDRAGRVLGLSEQKDVRGKSLITFFCKPCKPTKKNGGRTRNLPEHDPERWEAFKEYNAQDVRTEKQLYEYVSRFPKLPAVEREYWILDQLINSTGIAIDRRFIKAAIETNNRFTKEVHDEMVNLTGVENPNSLTQLKAWFKAEGYEVATLSKEYLADNVDNPELPKHIRRVLRLRQLASKTSIAKYDAMLDYAQRDGRIRGLVQFYGSRTGRFTGRGVQVQNLKHTLKEVCSQPATPL